MCKLQVCRFVINCRYRVADVQNSDPRFNSLLDLGLEALKSFTNFTKNHNKKSFCSSERRRMKTRMLAAVTPHVCSRNSWGLESDTWVDEQWSNLDWTDPSKKVQGELRASHVGSTQVKKYRESSEPHMSGVLK
jgi:hypothetical protein